MSQHNKSRIKPWLRIIAGILILTFIAQDIAWANPDTLAPKSFFQRPGSRESATGQYVKILAEHIGIPAEKLTPEALKALARKRESLQAEPRSSASGEGAKLNLIGWGLQSMVYSAPEIDYVVKIPWFFYPKSAYLVSYRLAARASKDLALPFEIDGNRIIQAKAGETFPKRLKGLIAAGKKEEAEKLIREFADTMRALWQHGVTISFDTRILNCAFLKDDAKVRIMDFGRATDRITAWTKIGLIAAHLFNIANIALISFKDPELNLHLTRLYLRLARERLRVQDMNALVNAHSIISAPSSIGSGNEAPFMFAGELERRIIVYRDNVAGRPAGQVTMRACEISELSDKERPLIARALGRWINENAIHTRAIKEIRDYLKSNKKYHYKAYLAVSEPEINGRNRVEVEGVVVVEERGYASAVTLWEIRLENISILAIVDRPRFRGVGRQLLAYTVKEQLKRPDFKGIQFLIATGDSLRRDGLGLGKFYETSALLAFICKRSEKTVGLLKSACESGDDGARVILGQLEKAWAQPVQSRASSSGRSYPHALYYTTPQHPLLAPHLDTAFREEEYIIKGGRIIYNPAPGAVRPPEYSFIISNVLTEFRQRFKEMRIPEKIRIVNPEGSGMLAHITGSGVNAVLEIHAALPFKTMEAKRFGGRTSKEGLTDRMLSEALLFAVMHPIALYNSDMVDYERAQRYVIINSDLRYFRHLSSFRPAAIFKNLTEEERDEEAGRIEREIKEAIIKAFESVCDRTDLPTIEYIGLLRNVLEEPSQESIIEMRTGRIIEEMTANIERAQAALLGKLRLLSEAGRAEDAAEELEDYLSTVFLGRAGIFSTIRRNILEGDAEEARSELRSIFSVIADILRKTPRGFPVDVKPAFTALQGLYESALERKGRFELYYPFALALVEDLRLALDDSDKTARADRISLRILRAGAHLPSPGVEEEAKDITSSLRELGLSGPTSAAFLKRMDAVYMRYLDLMKALTEASGRSFNEEAVRRAFINIDIVRNGSVVELDSRLGLQGNDIEARLVACHYRSGIYSLFKKEIDQAREGFFTTILSRASISDAETKKGCEAYAEASIRHLTEDCGLTMDEVMASLRKMNGPAAAARASASGLIGRIYDVPKVRGGKLVRNPKIETKGSAIYLSAEDGGPVYDKYGEKIMSLEFELTPVDAKMVAGINEEIARPAIKIAKIAQEEGYNVILFMLDSLIGVKVYILKNNRHGIMGLMDIPGNAAYMDRDILTAIGLFHEFGHTGFHHTLLRGCGKAVRNALEGKDISGFDAKKLISYLRRELPAGRKLTLGEVGLIGYNENWGRAGRDLIYGVQDRIFGEAANMEFTRRINRARKGIRIQKVEERHLTEREVQALQAVIDGAIKTADRDNTKVYKGALLLAASGELDRIAPTAKMMKAALRAFGDALLFIEDTAIRREGQGPNTDWKAQLQKWAQAYRLNPAEESLLVRLVQYDEDAVRPSARRASASGASPEGPSQVSTNPYKGKELTQEEFLEAMPQIAGQLYDEESPIRTIVYFYFTPADFNPPEPGKGAYYIWAPYDYGKSNGGMVETLDTLRFPYSKARHFYPTDKFKINSFGKKRNEDYLGDIINYVEVEVVRNLMEEESPAPQADSRQSASGTEEGGRASHNGPPPETPNAPSRMGIRLTISVIAITLILAACIVLPPDTGLMAGYLANIDHNLLTRALNIIANDFRILPAVVWGLYMLIRGVRFGLSRLVPLKSFQYEEELKPDWKIYVATSLALATHFHMRDWLVHGTPFFNIGNIFNRLTWGFTFGMIAGMIGMAIVTWGQLIIGALIYFPIMAFIPIEKRLKSDDDNLRESAARHLSWFSTRKSTRLLISLLSDQGWNIARIAEETLTNRVRRGGKKAADDINREIIDVIKEKPSFEAIRFLYRIAGASEDDEKKLESISNFITEDVPIFAKVTSCKDIILRVSAFSKLIPEFQKCDTYPTSKILEMALASNDIPALIRSFEKEMKSIDEGRFEPRNPLHVALGYTLLRRKVKANPNIRRSISYSSYLELVERYRENPRATLDTSDMSSKEKAEVTYFSYEAIVLKEYLDSVAAQAKRLGLPLVVVENLSYGAVAISPIRKALEAEGIRVISTKVGSSECHHNPYALDENLFRRVDAEFIIRYKPVVVVIDGSSSVDNPSRSSPHYPDAYQGYRNYFITANDILDAGDAHCFGMGVSKKFLAELRKESRFSGLKRKMGEVVLPDATSAKEPYKIGFWYGGRKALHTRQHKKVSGLTRAPPKLDAKDITGPTLIIAQACLEKRVIPSWAKKAAGSEEHETGYYDDKDNFTRFYFYVDRYGPQTQGLFRMLAASEYERLRKLRPKAEIPPPPPVVLPVRQFKGFIFDFDGVLAPDGLPIHPAFVEKLNSILRTGHPVAIITNRREGELEEKLWSYIPPELRQNLHIFSNGGTVYFGFDSEGGKVELYRFKLEAADRDQILKAVSSSIDPGSFEVLPRDYKVKIKLNQDLRKDRKKIAKAIEDRLRKEGLDYPVIINDEKHINIFKFDKVDAARMFLDRCGLREEDILIVGDSARSFGLDRRLLSTFPKSVSVNIGSASPTISAENPYIIQTAGQVRNLEAVKAILDMVCDELSSASAPRRSANGGVEGSRGKGQGARVDVVAIEETASRAEAETEPRPSGSGTDAEEDVPETDVPATRASSSETSEEPEPSPDMDESIVQLWSEFRESQSEKYSKKPIRIRENRPRGFHVFWFNTDNYASVPRKNTMVKYNKRQFISVNMRYVVLVEEDKYPDAVFGTTQLFDCMGVGIRGKLNGKRVYGIGHFYLEDEAWFKPPSRIEEALDFISHLKAAGLNDIEIALRYDTRLVQFDGKSETGRIQEVAERLGVKIIGLEERKIFKDDEGQHCYPKGEQTSAVVTSRQVMFVSSPQGFIDVDLNSKDTRVRILNFSEASRRSASGGVIGERGTGNGVRDEENAAPRSSVPHPEGKAEGARDGADKQSRDSASGEIKKFWDERIQNGFVYHGTAANLLPSLMTNGFDTDSFSAPYEKVDYDFFRGLFIKAGGKPEDLRGFEDEDRSGFYITHSLEIAKGHAINGPERLGKFVVSMQILVLALKGGLILPARMNRISPEEIEHLNLLLNKYRQKLKDRKPVVLHIPIPLVIPLMPQGEQKYLTDYESFRQYITERQGIVDVQSALSEERGSLDATMEHSLISMFADRALRGKLSFSSQIVVEHVTPPAEEERPRDGADEQTRGSASGADLRTITFAYHLYEYASVREWGSSERIDLLKGFGAEESIQAHFADLRRMAAYVRRILEEMPDKVRSVTGIDRAKLTTSLYCAEENLIRKVLERNDYVTDRSHIEDMWTVVRAYAAVQGIDLKNLLISFNILPGSRRSGPRPLGKAQGPRDGAPEENARGSASGMEDQGTGPDSEPSLRIIGQRKSGMRLHDLRCSDGYLFMGIYPGEFSDALLKGYFYCSTAEERKGPSYLGNEVYEACLAGKFGKEDTAIAVFRSDLFNAMLERGSAGIEKVEVVEFRYPFILEGLPLTDIDYILLTRSSWERYERLLLSENASGRDALLKKKLEEYKRNGVYDKFVVVEPNQFDLDTWKERGEWSPLMSALHRFVRERNIVNAEYVPRTETSPRRSAPEENARGSASGQAAKIAVKIMPEGRVVYAKKGERLLDVLERNGFRLNTLCGGQGACGKCEVILTGDGAKETVRSCQAVIGGSDIEVLVPFANRLYDAKILGLDDYGFIGRTRETSPPVKGINFGSDYALAVDIGTTTVVASLINLKPQVTKDDIYTAASLNWQGEHGADVITRIAYADREGGLAELQKLVISTINNLLETLANQARIDKSQIKYAVLSGNTVMTHLAFGISPHSIGQGPEYAMADSNPGPVNAEELSLKIAPEAKVFSVPCVHGFLGGDIVSDLLIARLMESKELSLMIDFGTNGEIVLGNKEGLLSASCAMGPAFEGAGISCGIRAQEGAIESVKIDPETFEPKIKVIGDKEPIGICGTGLVDAISQMLKCGIITGLGRINKDIDSRRIRRSRLGGYEYILREKDDSPIAITEKDIQAVLNAKAAVSIVIATLLRESNRDIKDIKHIYIAGGFGRYLGIEETVNIGLLPDLRGPSGEFTRDRYEYIGNGSLKGAIMMALDGNNLEYARSLATKEIRYIDLIKGDKYRTAFSEAWERAMTEEGFGPFVSVRASASGQKADRETNEITPALREDELPDAVRAEIDKLNIMSVKAQVTLQGIFEDALGMVRDDVSLENLQATLASNEARIFPLVGVIKMIMLRIALLKGDVDTYQALSESDSPDTGLCFVIRDHLFYAALMAGLDAEQEGVVLSEREVHGYIRINTERGAVAIDAASGQLFPERSGHIAVAPAEEYRQQVNDAAAGHYSEERKMERVRRIQRIQPVFDRMRQEAIDMIIQNAEPRASASGTAGEYEEIFKRGSWGLSNSDLERLGALAESSKDFATEGLLLGFANALSEDFYGGNISQHLLVETFGQVCKANRNAISGNVIKSLVSTVVKLWEVSRTQEGAGKLEWFRLRWVCDALSYLTAAQPYGVMKQYAPAGYAKAEEALKKTDEVILRHKERLYGLSAGAQQLVKIRTCIYAMDNPAAGLTEIESAIPDIIKAVEEMEAPYRDFEKEHMVGLEVHLPMSIEEDETVFVSAMCAYFDHVPANCDDKGYPMVRAKFESSGPEVLHLEMQTLPSNSCSVQEAILADLQRLLFRHFGIDILSAKVWGEIKPFISCEEHISVSISAAGSEVTKPARGAILSALDAYTDELAGRVAEGITASGNDTTKEEVLAVLMPDKYYVDGRNDREEKPSFLGGNRLEFLTHFYTAENAALRRLFLRYVFSNIERIYLLSLAYKHYRRDHDSELGRIWREFYVLTSSAAGRFGEVIKITDDCCHRILLFIHKGIGLPSEGRGEPLFPAIGRPYKEAARPGKADYATRQEVLQRIRASGKEYVRIKTGGFYRQLWHTDQIAPVLENPLYDNAAFLIDVGEKGELDIDETMIGGREFWDIATAQYESQGRGLYEERLALRALVAIMAIGENDRQSWRERYNDSNVRHPIVFQKDAEFFYEMLPYIIEKYKITLIESAIMFIIKAYIDAAFNYEYEKKGNFIVDHPFPWDIIPSDMRTPGRWDELMEKYELDKELRYRDRLREEMTRQITGEPAPRPSEGRGVESNQPSAVSDQLKEKSGLRRIIFTTLWGAFLLGIVGVSPLWGQFAGKQISPWPDMPFSIALTVVTVYLFIVGMIGLPTIEAIGIATYKEADAQERIKNIGYFRRGRRILGWIFPPVHAIMRRIAIYILETDDDVMIKAAAARSLGVRGDVKAVPYLNRIIESSKDDLSQQDLARTAQEALDIVTGVQAPVADPRPSAPRSNDKEQGARGSASGAEVGKREPSLVFDDLTGVRIRPGAVERYWTSNRILGHFKILLEVNRLYQKGEDLRNEEIAASKHPKLYAEAIKCFGEGSWPYVWRARDLRPKNIRGPLRPFYSKVCKQFGSWYSGLKSFLKSSNVSEGSIIKDSLSIQEAARRLCVLVKEAKEIRDLGLVIANEPLSIRFKSGVSFSRQGLEKLLALERTFLPPGFIYIYDLFAELTDDINNLTIVHKWMGLRIWEAIRANAISYQEIPHQVKELRPIRRLIAVRIEDKERIKEAIQNDTPRTLDEVNPEAWLRPKKAAALLGKSERYVVGKLIFEGKIASVKEGQMLWIKAEELLRYVVSQWLMPRKRGSPVDFSFAVGKKVARNKSEEPGELIAIKNDKKRGPIVVIKFEGVHSSYISTIPVGTAVGMFRVISEQDFTRLKETWPARLRLLGRPTRSVAKNPMIWQERVESRAVPEPNPYLSPTDTSLGPQITERFLRALSQTYHALLIDVDGTILEDGIVPKEILDFICGLLRKGINVGLVSGRTTESLEDLVISKLRSRLTFEELKHFHIYSQNAGKGYNAATGEIYFNFEFTLKARKTILDLLDSEFSDLLSKARLVRDRASVIPIYIADEEERDLYTLKIRRRLDDEEVKAKLAQEVSVINSGISIDIMPKEAYRKRALEDMSKRLGLKEEEIARIADQGHILGVDYPFLNSPGGFSVNKVSPESQYPTATPLKGITGTLWLMQQLKFETLRQGEGSVSEGTTSEEDPSRRSAPPPSGPRDGAAEKNARGSASGMGEMQAKQIGLHHLVRASSDLAGREGKNITYLAIAGVSEDHIRAAFLAGIRLHSPVVFIIYRTQVDLKKFKHTDADVFTGWDQFEFMDTIRKIAKETDFPYTYTVIRDHGGLTFDPLLIKAVNTNNGHIAGLDAEIETAMERAKESLRADYEAGFDSFHVDNSILYDASIQDIRARIEPVLAATVETIEYLDELHNHSTDYGLEVQVNPIGGPENTDIFEFQYFLNELAKRLTNRGIEKRPDFYAANVGTSHGARVEEPAMGLVEDLDIIAKIYHGRFSQHGTSGVSPKWLSMLPGIAGKANVDTALTLARITAIRDLAGDTFAEISKYVLESELGKKRLAELKEPTEADKEKIVLETSRYYMQSPFIMGLLTRLPDNIRTAIIERMLGVFETYLSCFGFGEEATVRGLAEADAQSEHVPVVECGPAEVLHFINVQPDTHIQVRFNQTQNPKPDLGSRFRIPLSRLFPTQDQTETLSEPERKLPPDDTEPSTRASTSGNISTKPGAGSLESALPTPDSQLPTDATTTESIGSVDKLFYDLDQIDRQGKKTQEVTQNKRVLLSASLFDEAEAVYLNNYLKNVFGEEPPIQILSPNKIDIASRNDKRTRQNLVCVISANDYDDPNLWNGNHRHEINAALLILGKGDDFRGARYAYLKGIVALAKAIMDGDKELVKRYLGRLFDKDQAVADAKLLELLINNPRELANYIKFKPLEPVDIEELPTKYKIEVENYLVAA